MTPSLTVATQFFKSLGCSDILAKDIDETFGKIKAVYKDKDIVVRVQLKKEWGTDEATTFGRHWNDDRYPFSSVQLVVPRPSDGPDNSTHYLMISADSRRCFLCPREVVDIAMRGWANIELNGINVTVQTAIIENWTPKVAFFILADSKWIKDSHNIWEKPEAVPMDVDAFLASL